MMAAGVATEKRACVAAKLMAFSEIVVGVGAAAAARASEMAAGVGEAPVGGGVDVETEKSACQSWKTTLYGLQP